MPLTHAWITIDFSGILYASIAFILAYFVVWARIIWTLGTKGWLLLTAWLMLHFVLVRFLYFWTRHANSSEAEANVIALFSIAVTFSLLFLSPVVLTPPVFKRLFSALFILTSVYYFLIERNASLYIVYKMKTTHAFEYPPYSTFKKPVNWNQFFSQHNDRQWIREALVELFNTERAAYDLPFRDALFKSWEEYNTNHSDKILFAENGILKYGTLSSRQLVILAANEEFIKWWIERSVGTGERELMLIDFFNATNAYVANAEKDGDEMVLVRSLAKGHHQLVKKNSPQILKALDEIILTASKKININ